MSKLSFSSDYCKVCSKPRGLEEEHAAVLLDQIQRVDHFRLSGWTFSRLKQSFGLSKGNIDRALALLRNQGVVQIDTDLTIALLQSDSCAKEDSTCPV